jgi:Mn2+/Fe2+ NRAMP family transporter
MDDESWVIFRDKVRKVYRDNQQRWTFAVLILCFIVVMIYVGRSINNDTVWFVLLSSVVSVAIYYLILKFVNDRKLKLIHEGLVAVCEEQSASRPEIVFRAMYEWGSRYPDDDPHWFHCIDVQFESAVATAVPFTVEEITAMTTSTTTAEFLSDACNSCTK